MKKYFYISQNFWTTNLLYGEIVNLLKALFRNASKMKPCNGLIINKTYLYSFTLRLFPFN